LFLKVSNGPADKAQQESLPDAASLLFLLRLTSRDRHAFKAIRRYDGTFRKQAGRSVTQQ
jgi:hypothetical protein